MIVTVPDVRVVEKQSHSVLPILEVRGPGATDTVIGTNLVTNPGLEGGALTNWNSNDATKYPLTLDTTGQIGGVNSALLTRTATSPTNVAGQAYISRIPVTANQVYSAGMDFKVNQSGRMGKVYISWYTSTNTFISTSDSSYQTLTINQVLRCIVSGTAPSNATQMSIIAIVSTVNGSNAITGEKVWLDNCIFESGLTRALYYDGDMPADDYYKYQWTGTVKASTSQKLQTPWIPLQVIDATVSISEVGSLPLRELEASVMFPSDQNLIADQILTPYGAWIRAGQKVIRLDHTSFIVQHGVFRVDKVSLDQLTGEVKIAATDAGSMVEDDHLMTLAEGRVNTTETYLAAINRMITVAMTGITPWWTTLVNAGGASTTLKPKSAALQYDESRTDAVRDIAGFLTRRIVSSNGWSGDLFKLIKPPVISDPVTLDVKAGEFGNLVANSYEEDSSREDIFNCVACKYTTRTDIGGGKIRVEEKRLVGEFTDVDSIVRSKGPFGRPNRFAEVNEVDTDAEARTAIQQAIALSFNVAREFTISTTPCYGLEPGDIIMVTAPGGAKTRGMVIGASIPLNAKDQTWEITLRAFKMIDGSFTPSWYATKDAADVIEDAADWRDYPLNNGIKVDLEDVWKTGWTVYGGTKTPTQATMILKASGSGVCGMYSSQGWKDSGLHRFKGSASVRSVTRPTRIRVGLDFSPGGIIWGPWLDFNRDQTRTVVCDAIIPASAVTFNLRLEFMNRPSGNPPANTEVRVNSVQVEQAYIAT